MASGGGADDFDDEFDDGDVDAMLTAVAAAEKSVVAGPSSSSVSLSWRPPSHQQQQQPQPQQPQQQPQLQQPPTAPSPWNAPRPTQMNQQQQQLQQQTLTSSTFRFKPPPPQQQNQNQHQKLQQTSLPWAPAVAPTTTTPTTTTPTTTPWTTPHDVDEAQLATWVYPTNYPVREYQFNVVSHAIFSNTLVALPTGLGKTFIAAVVMYNFFRWFPHGKIVFMAPTKPLVAQQIEACFKITGIPQAATHELTGATKSDAREAIWREKRVFFLTPQVLQNDMRSNICDASRVVLVVVDEAHRAQGDHAYCQVMSELIRAASPFRVLALTATPGSEIAAVQRVVDNLLIQHIEIRTEDSLDIRPYIFTRSVETIVVHPTEIMAHIVGAFSNIVGFYMKRLYQHKVFYDQDPTKASRYTLMMAREKWRQTRGHSMNPTLVAMLEGDLGICMSMCSALQLLQQHGIRSFHNTLSTFVNEALNASKAKVSRARMQFVNNPDLRSLLDYIERIMAEPTFCSHPKLDNLTGILLKHFADAQTVADADADAGMDVGAGPSSSIGNTTKLDGKNPKKPHQTRVMIFSQYRESVDEIVEALNKHRPLLRVMSFVGQSAGKKGSSSKGLTQKEQLQVISQFQSGNFNVIVATSIGEEGLDIGEVDMIVCYDAQTSPIRMLQRMGRTGRKRQGRIIVLLSQGKEEESHRRAQAQYKSVQRAIVEGQGKKLTMYREGLWRVLPYGARPECDRKALTIPEYQRNYISSSDAVGSKELLEWDSVEGGVKRGSAGARGKSGRGSNNNNNNHDDNGLFAPGPARDALLSQDRRLYGSIDRTKTVLDLSRFAHWQTELLPESRNISRTDRSRALVRIITLCERLAQDEAIGLPCPEVEAMMRDLDWGSRPLAREPGSTPPPHITRTSSILKKDTATVTAESCGSTRDKRPIVSKRSKIVSLDTSEDSDSDDDDFELTHRRRKVQKKDSPVHAQSAPGSPSRPSSAIESLDQGAPTEPAASHAPLDDNETVSNYRPPDSKSSHEPPHNRDTTTDATKLPKQNAQLDKLNGFRFTRPTIRQANPDTLFNQTSVSNPNVDVHPVATSESLLRQGHGSKTELVLDAIDIDNDFDDMVPMETSHAPLEKLAMGFHPRGSNVESSSLVSLREQDGVQSMGHVVPTHAGVQFDATAPDVDMSSDMDDSGVVARDPVCPWNRRRDLVRPRPLEPHRLLINNRLRSSPSFTFESILGKIMSKRVVSAAPAINDTVDSNKHDNNLSQTHEIASISSLDVSSVDFDACDELIAAKVTETLITCAPRVTNNVDDGCHSLAQSGMGDLDHAFMSPKPNMHLSRSASTSTSISHDTTPSTGVVAVRRRRVLIPDFSSPDASAVAAAPTRVQPHETLLHHTLDVPFESKTSTTNSLSADHDDSTRMRNTEPPAVPVPAHINGRHAASVSAVVTNVAETPIGLRLDSRVVDLTTPDSGPRVFRRLRPGKAVIEDVDDTTPRDDATDGLRRDAYLAMDDDAHAGIGVVDLEGGDEGDYECRLDGDQGVNGDDTDGVPKRVGILRRTPLLERRAMRYKPRRSPKKRGTPILPARERKTVDGESSNTRDPKDDTSRSKKDDKDRHKRDKDKTKKQRGAGLGPNPFLDIEAALSSDDDHVSSDEYSEEGVDDEKTRRRFIVNDSDMSSQVDSRSSAAGSQTAASTPGVDMHAFYRASLLSPEQGGLGRRVAGAKFRLAKLDCGHVRAQYDDEAGDDIEEEFDASGVVDEHDLADFSDAIDDWQEDSRDVTLQRSVDPVVQPQPQPQPQLRPSPQSTGPTHLEQSVNPHHAQGHQHHHVARHPLVTTTTAAASLSLLSRMDPLASNKAAFPTNPLKPKFRPAAVVPIGSTLPSVASIPTHPHATTVHSPVFQFSFKASMPPRTPVTPLLPQYQRQQQELLQRFSSASRRPAPVVATTVAVHPTMAQTTTYAALDVAEIETLLALAADDDFTDVD